ncbi:MAG: o-succinylbenzoate synthase [Cytophagales bacterium]|nr:o-succinylbenzoate synthase [Cytophagales bacterium]MDW8384049.1 o-succinylbenzoate synthase [Flammeovirgaceae bacterium]
MKFKKIEWRKHLLKFRFEAGTSRGTLVEKNTYYILLYSDGGIGKGECSPLVKLSIDDREDYEVYLTQFCEQLRDVREIEEIYQIPQIERFPSILMGFETAWLDAEKGCQHRIFDSNFYEGTPIPINGLIWMGSEQFMREQIQKKIGEGFRCVKMKIGVDFEMEYRILKELRSHFSADELEIRVDANGAFTFEEAMSYLEKLSKLQIHSIEQPLRAGSITKMYELCKNAPLPIALDEELIGVFSLQAKRELLQAIRPHFIVLKPSLIGGFRACHEWIEIARNLQIGWWVTSALESNIGLNAICQFVAQYPLSLPQGLGTGQLYHNNIQSPLVVENGSIRYNRNLAWSDLPEGSKQKIIPIS